MRNTVFLDMAAAFAIGILSGMGIGGGGLLVIYLTLLRSVGQLEAQGLNLYFFIFASAAALFVHSVKRRMNWGLILLVGAVGMFFAYVGSTLASVTEPHLVRKLFGAMLVLSGGVSLVKTVSKKRKNAKSTGN